VNLPCKPETGFAGDFLRFNIPAPAWAPGIKIVTGKIEKGLSEPDAATSSHVYRFDLQRSSGEPQLALYMSFKFVVREWREIVTKPPNIAGMD